jgi:hypothetical protein
VVPKNELGLDEPDAAADDRAQRSIALRRGQAKFRLLLMAAYGDACAITGCSIGAILEACHIKPYSDFKD